MSDSSRSFSPWEKPVVNPLFFVREEKDEGAIMFDPGTGRVYLINETALAVWKLMDGSRTVEEAVNCLRNDFEDNEDMQQQVLELLEELSSIGAVQSKETGVNG